MTEADRKTVREALDLGKYYAEEVHHHGGCPYFDKALAILDTDKPTVPMAMLMDIGAMSEPAVGETSRAFVTRIAARHGYEVTE